MSTFFPPFTQDKAKSPFSVELANLHGSAETILDKLTDLIAEVTRYPREILTPDADLENDLGVDSVKLGEIVVALRRRFHLSDDIQIPDEEFRTIRSISTALGRLGEQSTPSVSAEASSENEASRFTGVLSELTTLVAQVTRYPVDILKPDADMENDLGIDSVKRGEILVAVRKHFKLPEDFQVDAESFQTLSSAAKMLVTGTIAPSPVPVAKLAADQNSPNYLRELPALFSANNLKPFLGKIALITGSGHGIGKNIAQSLARLGATVIVNAFHSREDGVRTTAEIIEEGGKAHFIWGSVANAQHREAMFEKIKQLGGLDFFVSNASNGYIGPFDQISEDHWAKGFQTNLVGLHQCALLAAPLMAQRGGGQIVTLSTSVANRHVADFACMAALKASVEALTRMMAVEFQKQRVNVNCISAGAVYGDLIKKFPDSDNAIRYWEEKSLHQRLVDPHEICNLVNFLLSDAVRSINGGVLVIDGGITIRL